MKIKTYELTGAALDWAVAKCREAETGVWATLNPSPYSTDWSQGGPIIEREFINVTYDDVWTAEDVDLGAQWGDTPLIAAMRCYVASKLGDEVEIPDELI